MKGSQFPSQLFEAQNCHPRSHLLHFICPFSFSFSPLPSVLRVPLLPFHGGNLRRFSTLQVLSVLKCPGSALPLEVAQGMAEGNLHNASKFVDVISGQALADVSLLSFRGPDSLLLVTYKIIFQPGSLSPTLPRFILPLRFCCGSRTVLMCTISFNLIGEEALFRCYPRTVFFFLVTHCLVNRLLNLFLMQFLIDLVRTRAISPWGRVVEVPPSHLVMPFV